MIAERDARAHELIVITALSAGKIVLGRYWSSLVTGTLAASALAPYLALAYFLGGVDLAALAFALAASAFAGTFLCAFALAAAAGVANKFAQRAGQAAVVALGVMGIYTILGAYALFVHDRAWRPSNDWTSLASVGITWIASLPLLITCLLIARSRFLPPESDRARAVRIGFFATLLVPFGAIHGIVLLVRWVAAHPGTTWAVYLDQHLRNWMEIKLVPTLFMLLVFASAVASSIALTGDLTAPRRVLKSLARRPFARLLASVTGPGAHRALQYTFICFILPIWAAIPASSLRYGSSGRPGFQFLALAGLAYTLFFTGLPLAVLEALRKTTSSTLRRTAALSFFAILVATVNILLAVYEWNIAMGTVRTAGAWLSALSPFSLIGESPEKTPDEATILAVAGLAVVGCLSWTGIVLKAVLAERALLRALGGGSDCRKGASDQRLRAQAPIDKEAHVPQAGP
ncbi:MAG: hypothetical protein ACUVYA_00880 [Planctomycetota bacterium]